MITEKLLGHKTTCSESLITAIHQHHIIFMDHKVPAPITAFYLQGEASDDIQQLDIDSGSDFSE